LHARSFGPAREPNEPAHRGNSCARPSAIVCSALAALTVAAFAQSTLPPPPIAPSAVTTGPWTILFDGKTINGLRGLQKPDFLEAGWKIENGALTLPKEIKQGGKQTGGDLVTAASFVDFEFVFEWKQSVSGNSGVLYFARNVGGKLNGHEYQIIDDMRHPDGLKGGPLKRTAALYGILPPAENKILADADAWNEGRIIVAGNHVEHWLNGAKVLEYELGSPALLQAVRASHAKVHPQFGFKTRTSIVLLDEGDEISFRTLKIRALTPPAFPPPRK
jgi:hypothetical protein